MRRITGLCTVVIGLFMTIASSAGAATVTFTPAFSAGNLGEGATLTADFTFTGTEYFNHVEPLTSVTIRLPVGTRVSNAGFPTCSGETLQNLGPQGCPSGSHAGPVGSLAMEVAFGTESVPESVTVESFFAPEGGLWFYAEGHSPVQVEFVMPGVYEAAPPFVQAIHVSVPLIETVPGAHQSSITKMTLGLGAFRNEGASEIASVRIPEECPSGKFAWSADAVFKDETSRHVEAETTCPTASVQPVSQGTKETSKAGAPSTGAGGGGVLGSSTSTAPPPILAQRQTVKAVSGVVTIRPKGASTFVALSGSSSIPDESEVEATNGRVIITAVTPTGQTVSAEVYGGRLRVHQDRTGETHFILTLPLSGCPRLTLPRGAAALASHSKHKSGPRSRHLWVSENGGRWGTNGRFVSTSVEGTNWLTLDECTKSEVKVITGKVRVRDLVRNKTKTITAGKSYTASKASQRRKG